MKATQSGATREKGRHGNPRGSQKTDSRFITQKPSPVNRRSLAVMESKARPLAPRERFPRESPLTSSPGGRRDSNQEAEDPTTGKKSSMSNSKFPLAPAHPPGAPEEGPPLSPEGAQTLGGLSRPGERRREAGSSSAELMAVSLPECSWEVRPTLVSALRERLEENVRSRNRRSALSSSAAWSRF